MNTLGSLLSFIIFIGVSIGCQLSCGTSWGDANNRCDCCTNFYDCNGVTEWCWLVMNDEVCGVDQAETPTNNPIQKIPSPTGSPLVISSAPTGSSVISTSAPTGSPVTSTPAPTGSPVTSTPALTGSPTMQTQCPSTLPNRCGTTWVAAKNNCGTCCLDNIQCTNPNETCWEGIDSCTINATPSPTVIGFNCPPDKPYRCGENWQDADQNCNNCCGSNDDCNGQTCFAGVNPEPCLASLSPTQSTNSPSEEPTTSTPSPTLSTQSPTNGPAEPTNPPIKPPTLFPTKVTPEPTNQPIPPTTKTPTKAPLDSICTTRCGDTWTAANTQCNSCCVNDGDCNGASCWSDLNDGPCVLGTNNLKTIMSCGNGPYVSLTLDDGPAFLNGETQTIIDELTLLGIKATFYLSPAGFGGDAASLASRCTLVQKLADAGHEIQSHSWSHPYFTSLTNTEILDQLDTVSDFIYDCSGNTIRPTIFRPPYGQLNKDQAIYINELGYIIGLWNLDSNDWRTPNDFTPISSNINVASFNGKSINLLVHDRNVYQIIDKIVNLFNNGYTFITQTECYTLCDTLDSHGICRDPTGYTHYAVSGWGL